MTPENGLIQHWYFLEVILWWPDRRVHDLLSVYEALLLVVLVSVLLWKRSIKSNYYFDPYLLEQIYSNENCVSIWCDENCFSLVSSVRWSEIFIYLFIYFFIYECLPKKVFSNELFSIRLPCETPINEHMELAISNFHQAESNSWPFDPKLNALTTRPRTHI